MEYHMYTEITTAWDFKPEGGDHRWFRRITSPVCFWTEYSSYWMLQLPWQFWI